MKYLVLIADIDEFTPCKNSLGDLVKKEYKIKHMPAFDFSYNNHEVTAVCFGIGKVNAAMGAALALTLGEYDGVINTGWSGAVSGVKKGEIIGKVGPKNVYGVTNNPYKDSNGNPTNRCYDRLSLPFYCKKRWRIY